MGAVPRVIGHHLDPVSLAVEAAILLVVIVVFGGIWLRERRRRVDPKRRVPELRD